MSTPARPIHKWDDRSHVGLLFALLDICKLTKEDLAAAAEHMQKQGFQTTYHGVNQHIQKLRRGKASPEKAALDGGDIKTEQPPSTPTPRKRKTPTPKKKGATPAKSAAYVEQSDEEGDMLPMKDEAPETPRRKRVKNESDEV